MSKKHVGYTLPGYNYLGPGNNIFLEEDIVNSADFIAYVHDIEYFLNTGEKNICDSDYKALTRIFKRLYTETGLLGDLAGFIELVLYPSMSIKI